MTEIYAVSSGQYSDYSILALFSTLEKAKDYAATREIDEWEKREEEIRIEVYVLDEPSKETKLLDWEGNA